MEIFKDISFVNLKILVIAKDINDCIKFVEKRFNSPIEIIKHKDTGNIEYIYNNGNNIILTSFDTTYDYTKEEIKKSIKNGKSLMIGDGKIRNLIFIKKEDILSFNLDGKEYKRRMDWLNRYVMPLKGSYRFDSIDTISGTLTF